MKHSRPSERASEFCARYGLTIPILLAPMAGACPPGLSIAVANAGGMGAMGALMSTPEQIRGWAEEFRSNSNGPFQLNTWVPDPLPARNHEAEEKIRDFLGRWGPPVPASAGDAVPQDFNAQCDAFLEVAPTAVSSIMGVFPRDFIGALKDRGIAWFATATTLKGGENCGCGGRRRDYRARVRSGRTPGLVRGRRSGTRRGRTSRARAARCRRDRITGDCSGWNRRRAGRRGCLDDGSECRHARHSLSALSRSANEPGVG
jgi:hypothetical protein